MEYKNSIFKIDKVSKDQSILFGNKLVWNYIMMYELI